MKKAIALLVAAMLLTGLSACGGSTTADAPAKSDGTSKTETNKEEPKPQPADLTGTWKQTNSNDPSSYMECFASMFVRQVRQCFSAVWADGFPRCRHRFPVM